MYIYLRVILIGSPKCRCLTISSRSVTPRKNPAQ